MSTFQPPPTWANPVLVDETTGRGSFNPVWLKWFIELSAGLDNTGAGSGTVIGAPPTTPGHMAAWQDAAATVIGDGGVIGGAAHLDVGSIAGTVAAGDKGVTNGNSHNHTGGAGAQIAYSSLSGLPALGGAVFTQHEIDLGNKPVSNGSFTIAGVGLTTGKPVLLSQAAAAYTGKGTYPDEIEMDQIVISGYVQDATTIKCHWGSSTLVRGNVKFNYLVGA